MKTRRRTRENGSTTVEFALLFPLAFLITFFAMVILFRYVDALMLTYQANRVARIQAITASIPSSMQEELQTLPFLNQFQERASSIVLEQEGVVESELQVRQGFIPEYLITLSLSQTAQDSTEHYKTITERAFYVYGFEELDE
ncbi:MAG: pilus assembly protein [Caldisericia bacterium]|nr:pilus assembly protein [Caldisericia bacterium]MDD4614368.1 pilus assembly protein [Caldisericia bacterium]